MLEREIVQHIKLFLARSQHHDRVVSRVHHAHRHNDLPTVERIVGDDDRDDGVGLRIIDDAVQLADLVTVRAYHVCSQLKNHPASSSRCGLPHTIGR